MVKPLYTRLDVERADKAIVEALISLRNAIEHTYTRGMVVLVHRGRMKVQIEITGYPGAYQQNAHVLQGFNLKTGNTLKFHWRDIQEILGKRGPQGSIIPLESTDEQ